MISLLGAHPIFVDIEPSTFNMAPELIEAKITSKTKAIMPVSLYGQPADFAEINEIGKRHNIPIIEDAAQSFGAPYKGKRAATCVRFRPPVSFRQSPSVATATAARFLLPTPNLHKKMEQIRVHGRPRATITSASASTAGSIPCNARSCLKNSSAMTGNLKRRNEITARFRRSFPKPWRSRITVPEVRRTAARSGRNTRFAYRIAILPQLLSKTRVSRQRFTIRRRFTASRSMRDSQQISLS